jgi:hypothetical protein
MYGIRLELDHCRIGRHDMTSESDLELDPGVASGLRAVLGLSPEEFDLLVDLAKGRPRALWRYQWVAQLSRRIKAGSPAELGDLIDLLVSMSGLFLDSELEVGQFAERSVASLPNTPSLRFTDDERVLLGTRLAQVLDAPGVLAAAKGIEIVAAEPMLTKARVVEDIRPIFGKSVEEPPIAVVVLFRLKLDRKDGDATDAVEVVLDEDDLGRLRKVLDRADQKLKSIEALMATADWPYVKIEPR